MDQKNQLKIKKQLEYLIIYSDLKMHSVVGIDNQLIISLMILPLTDAESCIMLDAFGKLLCRFRVKPIQFEDISEILEKNVSGTKNNPKLFVL